MHDVTIASVTSQSHYVNNESILTCDNGSKSISFSMDCHVTVFGPMKTVTHNDHTITIFIDVTTAIVTSCTLFCRLASVRSFRQDALGAVLIV